MDLSNLTIKSARQLLDSKKLSVKELTEAYIKNIYAKNKELNVYLEVYNDVEKQAEAAQKKIDGGESAPLTGIPLAIKDNILIKGKKASAASKILQNYTATYTATAAQKIIEQGGVFLGRTNMDEFALGGSTEKSAYGPTKNPHDLSRVPGGTSGGSAAAVSADLALGALGSDTGGSIRQPAAFCGVVGLKPTYGAVSRYGLVAAVSSFDCIGPIAKTVSDAEIIFDCIRGWDKMDSTSIELKTKNSKLKARTIGIPYHVLEQEGISSEVKTNFEQGVKRVEKLGYKIVDIKLKDLEKVLAVYYIINFAEVSSNLARFDGVKYGLHVDGGANLLKDYLVTRGQGFGVEAKRRIILGTYVLSAGYYDAYYGKAMTARRLLTKEFNEAFEKVDAIITPTAPTPAWKIGEKTSSLEDYLADVFTVTANIVGIPAISIPSGFSSIENKKLPLGLQIMAPHMSESTLFKIGKKFLGEI